MTERKKTMKALVCSSISLLLSFSMLLGTTLAWFTDSVSSVNNIIKSGILDAGFEYAGVESGKMNDWAPVEGSSEIFDPDALWEPGRVEVVYLKVSNPGTLALRYRVSVNIYSETPGENAAGEVIKLSDHLVFKAVEMGDTLIPLSDRETAKLMAGNVKGLKDYRGSDRMLEVGGVDYVALIVYMPEDVGNEANYRGSAIPKIELGLNLLATQASHESDSFGPDYDADIDMGSDLGGLRDTVSEGGKVAIDKDITVTDDDRFITVGDRKFTAALVIDKDTDLYFEDFDFSYDGIKDLDALIYVINGATLNIYGYTDAVLSVSDPTGANVIAATDKSTVNIYGAAYTSSSVPVIDITDGATVNVYRGLFSSNGFRGDQNSTDYMFNIADGEGCALNLYGGTFVNFDPRSARTGSLIDDEHSVISAVRNGGEGWYAVVPNEYKEYTPVHDIKEAEEAAASGIEEIFFAVDIRGEFGVDGMLYGNSGKAVHAFGNGATVTLDGTGINETNYGYMGFVPLKGQSATVSDFRFVGSGFVELGDYRVQGGVYEVNNVTVENMNATYHIFESGTGMYIAHAFAHYGTATLTNCVMTGATTIHEGYIPYDAGFPNKTKTVIDGGKYGSIYLWAQAHVKITNAEVDVIDSSAITSGNLGKLTIGAGTKVGTINLIKIGKYKPSLIIEEGAEVGEITFDGVSYTVEEWKAR